ncbi:hypothetical protein Prudu_021114 [Prunus dulcis]|uniref:Uncharacterized protein n=1 Tax=Prunus dulcis TaxID=3755 RepID=A0A4Y1RXU5_PRUDU|nr:hypothetical protein Prudu_021114 [Prunus dulcis]
MEVVSRKELPLPLLPIGPASSSLLYASSSAGFGIFSIRLNSSKSLSNTKRAPQFFIIELGFVWRSF